MDAKASESLEATRSLLIDAVQTRNSANFKNIIEKLSAYAFAEMATPLMQPDIASKKRLRVSNIVDILTQLEESKAISTRKFGDFMFTVLSRAPRSTSVADIARIIENSAFQNYVSQHGTRDEVLMALVNYPEAFRHYVNAKYFNEVEFDRIFHRLMGHPQSVDAVQALIDFGLIDFNRKNRDGFTPIELAKRYRAESIQNLILDNQLATPIYETIRAGDLALFRKRVKNIAPRTLNGVIEFLAQRNHDIAYLREALKQPGVDVNQRTSQGSTLLFESLIYKNVPAALEIVKANGVDVNAKSKHEETALMLAAREGFLPVVDALLKVPSVDIHAKNVSGASAKTLAEIYKFKTTSLDGAMPQAHQNIINLITKRSGTKETKEIENRIVVIENMKKNKQINSDEAGLLLAKTLQLGAYREASTENLLRIIDNPDVANYLRSGSRKQEILFAAGAHLKAFPDIIQRKVFDDADFTDLLNSFITVPSYNPAALTLLKHRKVDFLRRTENGSTQAQTLLEWATITEREAIKKEIKRQMTALGLPTKIFDENGAEIPAFEN